MCDWAEEEQAKYTVTSQAAALGGAQDEDAGSEDESWGDELERELEGDEAASQPEVRPLAA